MNTKYKAVTVFILTISFFASGCGPGKVFGPAIIPTPTMTSTLTSTLIPTFTPTQTLTPAPTLTNTVTLTPIYPPIESFIGTWKNINPNTGSTTKIEITAQGNVLLAHLWGACEPSDCDAGTTSAQYKGNPVTLYVDEGFAKRIITLLLESDTLHMTMFSHYTDNSRRKDRTWKDDFRK
jgi:hypothetical protein